jgi:DNA primase catalytic subunit
VPLVIEEQQYLNKDANLENLIGVLKSICELKKCHDKAKELEARKPALLQLQGSLVRWDALRRVIGRSKKEEQEILAIFDREVTIGLLYPKIDSHVSAQVNHLLKCPFNVHHETGKLSLPILDIETFDVSKCPTIHDVLAPGGEQILAPYLDKFDHFCEGLIHKQFEAVRQQIN